MPLLFLSALLAAQSADQSTQDQVTYSIALPEHAGQLHWDAPGFKITQNSAKANGHEIGFRGVSLKSHLGYLAFLFLSPDQTPMTSAKCRDGVMQPLAKENRTVKVLEVKEAHPSKGPAILWVSYSAENKVSKSFYHLRGFVATGDLCGDLEITSDTPIEQHIADVNPIVDSDRLDPGYQPGFSDLFQYAQILYNTQSFEAAAPLFEKALATIGHGSDGKPFPSESIARRVTTDQAGMAYGISGNYAKARAIFEQGITKDPEYPMYYYNLACADAGENKLNDAEKHLQQAFTRKVNLLPGETMPDPTKDGSFLPYKENKEFWQSIERLNR